MERSGEVVFLEQLSGQVYKIRINLGRFEKIRKFEIIWKIRKKRKNSKKFENFGEFEKVWKIRKYCGPTVAPLASLLKMYLESKTVFQKDLYGLTSYLVSGCNFAGSLFLIQI